VSAAFTGTSPAPARKDGAETLSKHAIIPQQQFAYTTGKNASDITLVIDAMDLLHSGRFDGFCLVSSDSDFTRLAARIREQGVDVFGFGEQKTPESFRQACRRFIYTENLTVTALPDSQDTTSAAKPLKSPNAATPGHKENHRPDGERGWLGCHSGPSVPNWPTWPSISIPAPSAFAS
jgi:hypothetical protein